jgi:hypothetical protein
MWSVHFFNFIHKKNYTTGKLKMKQLKQTTKLILVLGAVLMSSILFVSFFNRKTQTYDTINLNTFEDWEHIEQHQYTKLTKKENHLLLIDNNQMLQAYAKNEFEDVSIGELVVNLKVLDNKDGYFFLNILDENGDTIFQIFRNNYGDYYFITEVINLFLFDEDGSWDVFNISFNCNSGRYDFTLNDKVRLDNHMFDATEISSIELKTHKQTFQSKTEIDFQLFKVWE